MAQRTHYYETDADQYQDSGEEKLSEVSYYAEYHGHAVTHLHQVLRAIRGKSRRPAIYLVGDSTMDNKYWLPSRGRAALNGYENLFDKMKPDVAYFVNKYCTASKKIGDHFCINAAIEESTLNDRPGSTLMSHDIFVRDTIQPNDVLICSVGGNDIALKPTCGTVFNISLLLNLNTMGMIESGYSVGLSHFIRLFKDETTNYLKKLCEKNKPKVILVCCIYYLDEKPGGSWADRVLQMLGYDSNPAKLQLCIRKIFEFATSKIEIEGTTVVPVPMFKYLDGKNTRDYVQRVEPSIGGGEKLGKAFVEYIEEAISV